MKRMSDQLNACGNPMRKKAAFSLIEVLMVVAVIAILAALLLQTSGYVQDKAARARAESEITAIENALENYRADNGNFPIEKTGERNSTKVLIDALYPTGTDRPYMEIPKNMIPNWDNSRSYEENVRAASFLRDPWDNPYRYYFDPEDDTGNNPVTDSINNNPHSPDIWSTGKKGNPEDWVKNW